MRLLYLSAFALIFISSTAFATYARFHPNTRFITIPVKQNRTTSSQPPDIPVLTNKNEIPILSAQSVLAVDLESGVTLYEKNPDGILLPASTTKIITALVALDYYSLNKELEVGNVNVVGQKMGLVPGEKILVRDLLYGLLVFSANDAAEVIAQNYPGGRGFFIVAMNQKAKELNLENTLFTNPSGLEGSGHVSTSRDLVRASVVAMRSPVFREIVGTKEKTVQSTDGNFIHRLVNINELIGEVDGVLGVKTGWTHNARENLITYVERNNRKVMIALLGSQDRFGETKQLINWIFNNYRWEDVQSP